MSRSKRKRKVAVAIDEEKENETETALAMEVPVQINRPMCKIMSHVQNSEALHKKYIKEMQQLYSKMDHKIFMFSFKRVIMSAMECDETNDYALTSLQFCAKYIASYNGEDTHPVLESIFDWISETTSNNPHIRFRLCQFVNLILTALGLEAALDDAICDKILKYMVLNLSDISPSVRVQAIVALQRLQMPDNPNDQVLRLYQFHLCSDPSPRVRQAVISCMGRNYITIPYILDRLWDIEEKVRRHTYLHMSSYPVRSYKVSQRLMLLEQGLNDRAESVRKVVTKVMLRQWLESYQKDIIALISALKLDANEEEIKRFRKVTKQTLHEIFKSEDRQATMELLPLDYEGEFHHCVLFENLSVEIALYWQCLSEYLQAQSADEFDAILPELSVFCSYVQKFTEQQKPDADKFQRLEFQYKLLALLEILYKYDLGDEIGRGNFQNLLDYLLRNVTLDDKNIEIIVRCAESLMTDQNKRMQFFTDIIQDLCQLNKEQNHLWNDRTLINEALARADDTLNLKLSKLKVKILDLEEQETTLLQNKNYVKAQEVTDEKNLAIDEYLNLLKPLLPQPLNIKKVNNDDILTSLQIIFHMVVSVNVRSLSPQVCKLYNDFICRHIASAQTTIRDWALKCGTAYSMHYEPIAKDLFNELYSQFFKHHNARIWETSVKCIFEIMDLYGIDCFSPQEQNANSKRSGRLLYNTLGNLDGDDETQVSVDGQGVGVIYMMSHFLDTCDNVSIISEIILGFIKLILHGFIDSGDIIEKLLIRYFNPSTDTKINQYLSIFLEEMIKLKKQSLLVPSLIPTLSAVLGAPYDSPLLEIRPETITRFFIDITRQDACPGRKVNLHNKIAHSFLTEMLNNTNNKELCKLLSKELLKLEVDVRNNQSLKKEMMDMSIKLRFCEFDVKTQKNLNDFQDMLNGIFNPTERNENDSDDDETLTNNNERNTASVATETTTSATPPVDKIIATTVSNEESESTLMASQMTVVTEEPCNSTATEAEKAVSESNIASADEVPGTASVSDPIESSQTSSISAQTVQSSVAPETQSQPQSQSTESAEIPTATLPTVLTTYGFQNRVGQYCLRKSLNSSRAQSESEMSDSVSSPKIRIELRIDSETKKKSAKANQDEKREISAPAKKTPKAINSVSGRSLRQLRGRKKSISPTPIANSENKSDASSNEESSASEVVPESPQPVRETSIRPNRTLTRLRRAPQSPKTNSNPLSTRKNARKQKQQNIESEIRNSPRQIHTSSTSPPNKSTRVPSPRKVLYTLSSPTITNSRKRAFPRTPYPKKKSTPPQSSTESTSSSSKSPIAKQPRRSRSIEKAVTPQKTAESQKSIVTIENDSNQGSTINELKTPIQKRTHPKISLSTTKVASKYKRDNDTNRRKSSSNLSTQSRQITRSAFKKEFLLNNIMTRNKRPNLVTEKKPPASKIPVKNKDKISVNKSTSQFRSFSSSPLKKNTNRELSKPTTRSQSSERPIRSKIPRPLR